MLGRLDSGRPVWSAFDPLALFGRGVTDDRLDTKGAEVGAFVGSAVASLLDEAAGSGRPEFAAACRAVVAAILSKLEADAAAILSLKEAGRRGIRRPGFVDAFVSGAAVTVSLEVEVGSGRPGSVSTFTEGAVTTLPDEEAGSGRSRSADACATV